VADKSIETYGSQVLRKKAEPVKNIDSKILKEISDMFETLHRHSGLGLAANQVGILHRLVVLTNPNNDEDVALINPEFVESDQQKDMGEEGCLSVPGIFAKVNRFQDIHVKAINIHGKEIQFHADNLLARIIQHEIDHLNGVLFIDRLSPTRRLMISNKLSKIQRYGDHE